MLWPEMVAITRDVGDAVVPVNARAHGHPNNARPCAVIASRAGLAKRRSMLIA